MTDIVPDSKVRAAMNDINASQRLRCGFSARHLSSAQMKTLVPSHVCAFHSGTCTIYMLCDMMGSMSSVAACMSAPLPGCA